MCQDNNSKENLEKDLLDIGNDIILNLGMYYVINKRVLSIIKGNSKIDIQHSFYHYLNDSYVYLMAVGIRRHLKVDKKSLSFKAFLDSLINDYDNLSIQLSKNEIIEDKHSIEGELKKVEYIVDKYIAHFDRKISGKSVYITVEEINEHYLFLKRTFDKYCRALIKIPFAEPLPSDWSQWCDIFKTPWIREG